MKQRPASLLVILLMVLGLLGSLVHTRQTTRANTPQATTTTVASGLDSPRGMAFGPDNALYVTEAGIGGSGPCITASTGQEVCYGTTGAVTRVDVDASTQQRVLTGLPSLLSTSTSEATGPHDITLFPDGSGYLVTGLGAPPERRSQLAAASDEFAQLAHITTDDEVEYFADLAAYEQANNPDGSLLDTNPYALDSVPHWHVVADAGANALLEVDNAGDIFRATSFPTRTVDAPGPPGSQVPMESVPDAVTVGPDGAYYVGELTGFPFPVDGARVYRVVPGQEPTIYADGFTTIIDLTFDKDGNLYVLEIAEQGLLQGRGPSALVQIASTPEMTRTDIITGSGVLTASTSLAINPEGGLYVTNSGIMSGTGEVLRVDVCDPGDTQCQEPAALPPALSVMLSGEAEVNSEGTPGQGDPDGSGRAIITLNESTGEACVQATTSDIAAPTSAHIHEGAAGINGSPVVTFTNLISGTMISGCVDAQTSVVQDILSDPSGYYLNIHNADFPAGAVRGQLASRETIVSATTLYLPFVAN
jgi:hypothetical protein